MNTKTNVYEKVAEFRIRVGRGVGVIYDFRQAMVLGAAAQIILKLSIMQAVIVTLLAYVGFFILGSLKFIESLWKKQAELETSKYNPHLNKLNRLTEKLK